MYDYTVQTQDRNSSNENNDGEISFLRIFKRKCSFLFQKSGSKSFLFLKQKPFANFANCLKSKNLVIFKRAFTECMVCVTVANLKGFGSEMVWEGLIPFQVSNKFGRPSTFIQRVPPYMDQDPL